MQVGTTKDQGLYNKPSAAVHPGALAAGTLPQYNTITLHFVALANVSIHQDHFQGDTVVAKSVLLPVVTL